MPEQLAAMSASVEELNSKIERAVADGQLMELAATNIRTLLAGAPSDLYMRVVDELVAADAWLRSAVARAKANGRNFRASARMR